MMIPQFPLSILLLLLLLLLPEEDEVECAWTLGDFLFVQICSAFLDFLIPLPSDARYLSVANSFALLFLSINGIGSFIQMETPKSSELLRPA